MAEEFYKEVDFGDYCKTCKHAKTPEAEDPCNECLEYPMNVYSHKPVNWKAEKGFEDYKVPDNPEK